MNITPRLKNIVPRDGKSNANDPLVKKNTKPAVSENIPRYDVVFMMLIPW
jgi:hypothetical protein